jgi:hypothetical protein
MVRGLGTMNVGSRALSVLPFYMALPERGATATRTAGAPNQDA